jgi:hypothetical protein
MGGTEIERQGLEARREKNINLLPHDMHPRLFIEAKQRFKHPILRCWDKCKKEAVPLQLIPVVTISEIGGSDIWILCHCDQFLTVVDNIHKEGVLHIHQVERKKIASINLWKETKDLAIKENKTPLVALQEKNRPGFWILAHANDLHTLANEVRKEGVEDVNAT